MKACYQWEDRTWMKYPETKEKAIEYKSPKYDGATTCEDCGKNSPKFVTTDNCMMCQRIKMDIIRHMFNDPYDVVPYPDNAAMPIRKVDWGKEVQDALTLLKGDFRMSMHPCKAHGHIGLVNAGGHCHYCSVLSTPKKQAMIDGEEWYVPRNPCPDCNTIAKRHVTTAECSSCGYKAEGRGKVKDEHDNRETADSMLMRQEPDMVIDRATAELCDMKVYRTGEPCKHGHTGWRYVKTRNCIPCLRGRS